MLKQLLLCSALVGLLSYPTAQAATVLQLDPLGGAISGLPGSTVGWGFNLSNNENFLVVTSAAFEAATELGTFTDLISVPDNFFVVGPALGGSTVWTQSFNAATQTGIGSFAIDAGAALGSVAFGTITLTYDLFSRSPLDPLFSPDTDTLSNGNLLTANASVAVPIPEPQTWAMLLAGIGLLGWSLRRGRSTECGRLTKEEGIMRKALTCAAVWSGLCCVGSLCGSPTADAATITATVTADNHYALYYGTQSNLTFVGRNEKGSSGNPGDVNWSVPVTFGGSVLGEDDRSLLPNGTT
jgi:hypothetical protein